MTSTKKIQLNNKQYVRSFLKHSIFIIAFQLRGFVQQYLIEQFLLLSAQKSFSYYKAIVSFKSNS